MKKKHDTFKLSPAFYQAFSNPEKTGIWLIWGNSGSGKTSFTIQLCEELARHERVVYNSLEEGFSKTMKNAIVKTGVEFAEGSFMMVNESIGEFDKRLRKSRAPRIVVIDSFQYTGMSFDEYLSFRDVHKNKLIIFTSHADGKKPDGRPAKKVLYDASLKIWVEGYRAYSNGRYIGPNGGIFTIWQEGYDNYYGNNKKAENENEA